MRRIGVWQKKLDLILRSECSERLEGPPHAVRGNFAQRKTP